MTNFSTLMGEQKLLPIIQANTPEEGVHIATAMQAAGLSLVEVVLRTEASMEALKAIKASIPSLQVGAGTVLNEKVLEQALTSGADFIVTPAVSSHLLNVLQTCGKPVLPGVSTTSDILLAQECGFNEQKLFPAALAGGAPFLSAMSSIFNTVRFCPTGGITQENQCDYLSLNNVLAVGGTWMAQKEWVEQRQWQRITDACLSAVANH
ncbi:bifunctional 4-hydroxy-2-oxoglutarate aldolase/2-dehydro-3-deoxy-phosphogluconate aldolase [Alteromonas ponticola]|uniref:Bifunctional 4-hydroxy-2-oxoglutarate aldolase/2-dehydro-3-deoxy-phosphogluconate aldolase n=1 Tax=Alteromonas ponticola TaxID=2720613 RepID=A0ABX1R1E6_9ALTE|nr:bifunctional 4-hydroxy-2-oxoglutarate aldolase/2-dehydro-3-deoxy-phosphogluconate aldolase [Alteromonas ponticola]NMH60274.1 bifunctional 4-hydroxy-2-oxoglutarate aldolase/2-dehydro-3-deoxy-phosphogluconate aldolase [Alteromonas ponticola]